MAQLSETFTVDCHHTAQHVLHITLDLDGLDAGMHELALPVWAPGAYEVRDFSRHVFDMKAVDRGGRAIAMTKSAKNVWQFEADGRATITYQFYAFELEVDTSHADATHAYWNGTNLFFVVD
ncbi:MAG: M61 family metallopeptidase, partial [Clostridia bacterium]